MKRIILLVLFVGAIVLSCSKEQAKNHVDTNISRAQEIVNRSIAFHKLGALENASFQLRFRNIDYSYRNSKGTYEYSRTQTDTLDRTVKDVLNNTSFVRYIDGEASEVTEERRGAYSRSVNSVIYFFRLPFGLNDVAVNKKYNGEKKIKGKTYHEIEVTFEQEGGGEDFDDVFLYWFDTEDYSMDFLAYLYHTDGGGLRFREAINPRRVAGALVQDYINFKPEDETIPISTILELYKNDELIELSRISNEDIEIQFN